MTSRELFVKYLKEQQWSMAASVSINAMRAGDQSEIEWYFNALMNNCDRYRVIRMTKTWGNNDVPMDLNNPSYGNRFYETYRTSVWGIMGSMARTDQQRRRREEFNRLYFKDYPVQDRLVMWIAQGAAEREAL